MDIESRIRSSFARQGMMTTLGAQLRGIAPGAVGIAAPIAPAVSQQHGYAHAALAFAIGDSAAGYAALSVMPPDREVVTSEMKIHLLAPARGAFLLAQGRVVRAGRRLVVVTADVMACEALPDAAGQMPQEAPEKASGLIHVALLTGTMIPV